MVAGSGLYVAFTGVDGAGKSLQAGLLHRHLTESGLCSHLYESREEFAVQVMRAIAARHGCAEPRQHFGDDGFELARAFDTLRDFVHIADPLRRLGCIVVSPRSPFCRLALARARGCSNLALLREVTLSAGVADLTVWLDTPVDVCVARIERRGIDREDPALLRAFDAELRAMSAEERFRRVDGDAEPAQVHARVRALVDPLVSR